MPETRVQLISSERQILKKARTSLIGVLSSKGISSSESRSGGEHVGECRAVEAGVDVASPGQQCVLAEAPGQDVDVGEVAGCRPVEEGEQFVPGKFFGVECRSGFRLRRRGVRRRVHREVEQHAGGVASDDHPAERVAVVYFSRRS